MIRIFITYVLPLVLPTLLYFAWTAWVRKKVETNRTKAKAEGKDIEEGDHTHPEDFDIKTPWFRLILAGVGLMMVGLVLSVFFGSKNPPDSIYQPPRLEGNTVIPGQYAPKPK